MHDQAAGDPDAFAKGAWSACLYAVPDMPLVHEGDDVAAMVYSKASANGFSFRDGDVVVVAHKIVSKAEGAVLALEGVVPSAQAHDLARASGRAPRLCEVYVKESREVLGTTGSMVITRHRLGFVCTNAGVDRSNVPEGSGARVVLLPREPDASARAIRERLRALTGRDLAVIISDSFGKPDRAGAIGEEDAVDPSV